MIAIIRIKGLVEVPENIQERLIRINLRRKYNLILMNETENNLRILNKIRNYVAYGKISKEVLIELIEKRAVSFKNKKIDASKIAEEIEKKNIEDLGIRPFFSLHPPRGGINTKSHFPIKKGVLGDNKEKINELIRRML